MVLEVVLSILIVSTSLITAFRNESNSISVTLGFITFVLILAFAYSGPEVSILLGLGVTPLLYLLLQTRATSTKQFKARSSVVEKVMTYLSLAPLFGFVVLLEFPSEKIDFNLNLSELHFSTEIFLFIITILSFLEILKRRSIK